MDNKIIKFEPFQSPSKGSIKAKNQPKEYIRHESPEFTRELNFICDVIPQTRSIANQVHKIIKLELGYHLYSEEGVKIGSVSMARLTSHAGHGRY